MKSKLLKGLCLLVLIFSVHGFGQVGINTEAPAATLDIVSRADSKLPAGVIAPRLTADELIGKEGDYGVNQNGAIVYITQLPTLDYTATTKQITAPGYYFYSSEALGWVSMSSGTEPWYNAADNSPATNNTQTIYQNGQVAIGGSSVDANAQLEISSNDKGVLLPRLSTAKRDAMPSGITNGMLVYNASTDCFNYFSSTANKWLSLCGTFEPATFNLINCSAPTGFNGTYTKGSALNSSNTYKLLLNVATEGTYQIVLKTNNGYTFIKTGTFSQSGPQEVLLEGQGSPTNGPQTDAITSVEFNGIQITPDCSLPSINVAGNTTAFTVNCASATLVGTYLAQVALNVTNYIDVPVTSVQTPGNALVETATINGIKFSSGNINITAGTTSIRLYGSGTPTSKGTNTYTFLIPGSTSCSVDVTVASSLGTFTNPANRCFEIKTENASAADGYYWIKDNSSNKFKTYCDMSNGGWTLVNSRSEKQMLVDVRSQNLSINTLVAKNPVTTLTGVFNEYDFSLSSAVMNNIGSSKANKEIRIIIKQAGSTGTTVSDVENSTVAPINDTWAKENYYNVTVIGGNNPYTQNYTTNEYTSQGKLFNIPFGKPVTGATNYNFDSNPFNSTPVGFYSSAGFFTGFYGGLGNVSSNAAANNVTYTYTSDATKSFTFNKYYINDIFGLYQNSETQLNHHIGTCNNSTDDFGGTSNCAAGWANWRPHNLNLNKAGKYEGRLLQYYVK